jgi:hypothetical protein
LARTGKGRRRPSGDGSIYRDSDGRRRGVVDPGWVDGRRRRKYVCGSTQAETLANITSSAAGSPDGHGTDPPGHRNFDTSHTTVTDDLPILEAAVRRLIERAD